MAQATGGGTLRDMDIELSFNGGGTWTDYSGYTNSIEPGDGEREIGEFHTADGDVPVIGAGKRAATSYTIKVLYTEGASELAMLLKTAFDAATLTMMRYAPRGKTTGKYLYTTTAGYIKSPVLPGGEVQSGDPTPIEFNLVVADTTSSVVA